MEGARGAPRGGRGRRRVAEEHPDWHEMKPEQLLKKAKQLEQRMYRHARDLEFEEAAKVRDEIERIRKLGLGLDDRLAS